MLALKNTTRAQRLYKPVARMMSVRKARRRVLMWSIMTLVGAVLTIATATTWSTVLFTGVFLGLMWRLVCWQDIVQQKWEREHTL